jgi:hypothetical protein
MISEQISGIASLWLWYACSIDIKNRVVVYSESLASDQSRAAADHQYFPYAISQKRKSGILPSVTTVGRKRGRAVMEHHYLPQCEYAHIGP